MAAKLIEFFAAGLEDTNGTPLSGYQVRTYAVDGATAKVVWEDSAKTLPTAAGKAAFSLDTTGRAVVYASGTYVVKIWTVEHDPDTDNPYKTYPANSYSVDDDMAVSAQAFGAVGDGATDDSDALTSAVASNRVLDLTGKTYKGTITIPEGTENLTIRNGSFIREAGDAVGNFIVVGAYTSDADTTSSTENITIEGINFTTPTDLCNYGDIVVNKNSPGLKIRDCTFAGSGDTDVDSDFAIAFRVGSADLEFDFDVSGNIATGRNMLINNYSTGYITGGNISRNVMNTCHIAARAYHMRTVIYSQNRHVDCTSYTALWRSPQASENYWENCGAVDKSSVILEAINGAFEGNTICQPVGHGLIVDGGNSEGIIQNNHIYIPQSVTETTGKSGIFVDSLFNFGGQIVNTKIQGNSIVGMMEHGILVQAQAAVRGVTIKDNIIAACGREGTAATYCGIKFLATATGYFINLYVDSNIITGNDSSIGYQDSDIEYDIYVDDTLAAFASTFHVTANKLYAGATKVRNEKTAGSKYVVGNICNTRAIVVSSSGNRNLAGNMITGTDPNYFTSASGDAVMSLTGPPVAGTWQQGDIAYNATPSAAGFIGWVCTAAGTPGTWNTFGVISA